MLKRHAPAILRQVAIRSLIDPPLAIISSVIGLAENLRIEMAVPRSESGGTITFTREPSFKRRIGKRCRLVNAAANLVHDTLGDLEQVGFIAKLDRRDRQLALFFDVGLIRAVDHDIRDQWIVEHFLKRPKAQKFIHQHFFQRELFAAVERQFQFGEHFADDWPEFFGQFHLWTVWRRPLGRSVRAGAAAPVP